MLPVARLRQGVVQVAREFGGFDVGGVLIPKSAAAKPKDEAEFLDVGGQVGERKNGALALIQIVKLKSLEITHQDVAGFFSFGQGVEVFPRLSVGFRQIAARAFLLDDQNAWPEQVDVPVGIIQPPYVLLIARDGAALDAEDMEELVVETLRLAFFIRRASPCAGEARRAHAHLVPG